MLPRPPAGAGQASLNRRADRLPALQRISILQTVQRTRTEPLPVNFASRSISRAALIRIGAAVAAAVLLIVAVAVLLHVRSSHATDALNQALSDYDTPIANPSQPVPPGTKTYSSVEERARSANAKFADVASRYGMTEAGRNALYMQGVTALQMGQTAQAEQLLKRSADGWNADIAALSSLALAGLYHNSNRDSDAIAVYNRLIAKPSTTVPAGLAQLQLAELYESSGKADQAKKLYAQIKDKDPKSPAAEIASEKLNGTPAR